MQQCTDAIALAESCELNCMVGAYPNNAPADSTVVMTVVGNIELSGLKAAEFKAVEHNFKSALASTLSVPVDTINITKVTEISNRALLAKKTFPLGSRGGRVSPRKLQNDLSQGHLDIEYEITVASVDALNTVVSNLQGTYLHRWCSNEYSTSREFEMND